MSKIVQDLSTSALVTAIDTNMIERARSFAHLPQVEIHDEPDMFWAVTDIPHPLFNGVLRAQLAPGDIDAKIDATLAHFKSRNVPMAWWVGPSTRPDDLGRYLEAHGLAHTGGMPGMAVDLPTLNEGLPAPSELRIERVGDAEALKKWIHPFTIGFEFPEPAVNLYFDCFASLGFGPHLAWHHYVGLLKGEPVACSSLFLGAGVAGIYNVATVPQARRQGIGTAMSLRPLHEACAMGHRVGVLLSSPMGLRVYRRLGFKEYCALNMYTSFHQDQKLKEMVDAAPRPER